MSQIFRKKSLERLSSPEQLDTLIQITSPAGWLALSALAFIIIVAVLWGIFGSIHDKAQGHGYLIREIEEITPGFGGRVSAIHFKRGDPVAIGDVVADLSQTALKAEIDKKKREIEETEFRYKKEINAIDEKIRKQENADAARKVTLEQAIAALEKKIKGDEKDLDDAKKLLKKGIRTAKDVRRADDKLADDKNEKRNKADELEQLIANAASLQQTKTDRESARDRELLKLALDLERLLEKEKTTSQIKSRYKGIVLEVKVSQFQLIEPNTSILTLEQDSEQIQLIAYSPVMLGQKVLAKKKENEEGNKNEKVIAHISPTHVKAEEFGFIVGNVESVSNYPVSRKGMINILRNEDQVDNLMNKFKGSDLSEIKVSLVEDKNTTSGFGWTSSEGPPYKIGPGAECFVKFIVGKKRPIELVIPKIKGLLGLM